MNAARSLVSPSHWSLQGGEKSCQPGWAGQNSLSLRGRKVSIHELRTPQVVIDASAMEANIAAMASWTRERGVLLAPHGKTTMSPQIWERQLQQGAWGITVTTQQQAEVAVAARVPRVQIAAPIASRGFARWVARAATADRPTHFLCWVDSAPGIDLLGAAMDEVGATRTLDVLIEVGHAGGRTGARGAEAAGRLATSVRGHPRLALRGIAAYEGTAAHGADPASLSAVDALVGMVADRADDLRAHVDDEMLVSIGGSAYFDRIVSALANRPGLTLMLRSGGYVTHDDGYYASVTPAVRDAGPVLRAAMTAWARVLSVPEPGLALLDAGRRDVPDDEGLPVPRFWCGGGEPVPFDGAEVVALNDQHAHLRFPSERPLAVGDLIGLGLSHPCAAWDRWGVIPVMSAMPGGALEVEELVWTFLR